MKRPGLLLLLLAMGCFGWLSAQTWQLDITDASQQSIEADMHVTNNTGSAISWSFGYITWLHLFIDGQDGVNVELPAGVVVNIPVSATITQHISFSQFQYYPVHPIPLGTHTVQAYRRSIAPGEPTWTPVGNIETVFLYAWQDVINPVFTVEAANQDSITVLLSITNTDIYPMHKTFTTTEWAWIELNGIPDLNSYSNLPSTLNLAPNETRTFRVRYNPTALIPGGNHELQVGIEDFGYPGGILILIDGPNNQVVFETVLKRVSQVEIVADLFVTNNTSQDIHWGFNEYPWAEMFVDGQNDLNGVFPALWNVDIPIGETVSIEIVYSHYEDIPSELIPLGTHSVQAMLKNQGIGEPIWTPVGNTEIVAVYDTYHFIDITCQPQTISQETVSVLVSLTNTDEYQFLHEYTEEWAFLYIDGQVISNNMTPLPGIEDISSGETESLYLTYQPMFPLAAGLHQVQVFIRDYGFLPAVTIDIPASTYPLAYNLDVVLATPQVIVADLNMINNTDQEICWEFTETGWADLFVDGENDISNTQPAVIPITIQPGATHTEYVSFSPLAGIPVGTHSLQAKTRTTYEGEDVWVPVGYPVTVQVNPTPTTDVYIQPIHISAYPNPFHSRLTLSLKTEIPGKAELEIYNIKGKQINTLYQTTNSGYNLLNWDGNDKHGHPSPAGIYLIKVINGKTNRIIKCLKVE